MIITILPVLSLRERDSYFINNFFRQGFARHHLHSLIHYLVSIDVQVVLVISVKINAINVNK